MAQKEVILQVDFKGTDAVKTLQDLRNNIKALKEGWIDSSGTMHKGLNELTIGSAAYRSQLSLLQEQQSALKMAMHGTAASMKDIVNAASGANVQFDEQNKLVNAESANYNELVRVLDILKQQWRTTSDAAQQDDISEKINAVNDRLKEMDASVGVFGRNVGNYVGAADHLAEGIASMGKGAAAVINPIKGVTTAFKTLSTTPAIAVLGLLASVIQKVMAAMKSSEENAQGLAAAMAPLSAVGDVLTKILQGLGGIVVKVAEGFSKLTSAIFGTNDATKERLRLAQEEAALAKQQRETLIQNAEAEREVARLRAEASDKYNTTAAQRIELLEKAVSKEEEISRRAADAAKREYELIRDTNALRQSSKEALDKEAQAYSAMIKAETDYFKTVRRLNEGLSEARRTEARDAAAAAKAVKDAAVAKINAERDYLSQLLDLTKKGSDEELAIQNTLAKKEYEVAEANARQKIRDKEVLNNTLLVLEQAYQAKVRKNQEDHDAAVRQEQLLALRNRAAAYREGSVEYLAAVEEMAALDYDTMKRRADETDEEWKARRLEATRALAEAQQATADAVATEARLALENTMNALAEGSVEQLAKAVEIARYDIDNLRQGIDESDDEFLARRLDAEKTYREAVQALDEAEIEQGRQVYEQRLATLEEGSLAYLDAEVEMKRYELDTLHQLEGESEDEFRTRQLEADKAYYKAKKDQVKTWMSTLSGMASGVSGILGSIADFMESNTDMTESEAKKAKNLRIAGATIDMLNGAVTAYATAQSLGVPMGPIVGAINAAAVITSGMANIAKIKATQVNKNSASSAAPTVPASVQAPMVMPEVAQIRTVTSASEEDRLNRMASDHRVYILQSDLEAEREDRRVQVAETTW